MDYTSASRVRSYIHATSTADDVLIGNLITICSRAWDKKSTGTRDSSSDNYYMTEAVVGEVLPGMINWAGEVSCFPHKYNIQSVQSFAYRKNITQALNSVNTTQVDIQGDKVVAYPSSSLACQGNCRVTLSYTGGSGSTISDLPQDMVDIVTLLVVRFYREVESGLGDAIGVAELAQLVYTKAWPVRATDLLELYVRRHGWNHYG